MDFSIIRDSLPLYAKAAWITLQIGVIGIAIAVILGVICAAIQYTHIPVFRQIVHAYVEISRNTPLLIQLFFLYYGLPKLGIVMDAKTCAIVGLAFLGGSYMSEALRSGMMSVADIQRDSAISLGLSTGQMMRHVLIPQGVAFAIPAVTANVIFLMKETSVVSVIALADLVYTAKEQIGNTYNTQEALFLLVVFYLIILLPIALVMRYLEGRVRHAGFGAH